MRDRLAALGCALSLAASPSSASTAVSNLAETIDASFGMNGGTAFASSFTTGPTARLLESVTVLLHTPLSGSSGMRLRADAAGTPGALLENLGTQSLPSNQEALRTYPSAGTVLAANTTYWVTLGESGSGTLNWRATTSTNETSTSGWTIGDQSFLSFGGAWNAVNGSSPESGLFSVDIRDPLTSTEWVTVGSPGNACDAQTAGCFGSVSQEYMISRYEVTVAHFAVLLNAIAADDPNEIYNSSMAAITRSGSPGSYSYEVAPMLANHPISALSFYDALRFANWLHNGEPSGAQDATTTEDGAYTFSGPTSVGPRNPGALVALPTEDEWYKAAYYDATLGSYYDYPTGTNVAPTCSFPSPVFNTAACMPPGAAVDVGSYPGSPSPSGTLDQGGNVWEWNETPIGSERGVRGGAAGPSHPATFLHVSARASAPPTIEGVDNNLVGFRVVPEPGAPLQLVSGIALLVVLARRRCASGYASSARSPRC